MPEGGVGGHPSKESRASASRPDAGAPGQGGIRPPPSGPPLPSGNGGRRGWTLLGLLSRVLGRSAPLRQQALVLLTLALTPGVLYAGFVAYSAFQSDVAQVRADISKRAVAAAGLERDVIAGAERVGKALAEQPAIRNATRECAAILDRTLKRFPEYDSILVADERGAITCAAGDQGAEPVAVVSGRPWFRAIMTQGRPARGSQSQKSTDEAPGLVVGVPIVGESNRPVGVIALTVTLGNLSFGSLLEEAGLSGHAMLLTADGRPLNTRLEGPDSGFLPATDLLRNPAASPSRPVVFEALGADGVQRYYGLLPLPRGQVLLLFGMPEETAFDWVRRDLANRLVGPFAMLAFTIGVAWVALDRLVLFWLRRLRRAARAFGAGGYEVRLSLAGAPQEIQELGGTMERMASTIRSREHELEENLSHREILLKEIHHRVKNNLQVVSSLLSLQHRALPEGQARDALMQAQTRINALATVHRSLYETDDPRLVDLGSFSRELAQLTFDGLGGSSKGLRLETSVCPVMVTSDQAVPLSLMMTEALTNAIKHAFPNLRRGTIRVRLETLAPGDPDGTLAKDAAFCGPASGPVPVCRLTVEDDGIGVPQADGDEGATRSTMASGGIGSTLLGGLARQVGGHIATAPRPEGGTRVSIVFKAAVQ